MIAGTHRGIGMTSARTRERLIQRLKDEGIRHPGVIQAMRDVPRHIFVDEALASRAYEDTALPIGHGQTISQPYIVARMTELLLQPGVPDTVLEVGTGSGYQTAVLSKLVNRIYSVERIAALQTLARRRFQELGLRNIRLRHTDGGMGLPEYGPFDAIIVTAAPEEIPQPLLDQLKVGGSMIIPRGGRDSQWLVRVTRTATGYEEQQLERVIFVPLLGGVQ
ncbi:MAG: protein-L-isoaspartate(D-aspartate) O-methyltransferase [Gammaproteobacteria bacterium]|nr:protein-L-isoaspartate(D-aspartate) O-methyltransferase [Gammaproteobacteria bacterium]